MTGKEYAGAMFTLWIQRTYSGKLGSCQDLRKQSFLRDIARAGSGLAIWIAAAVESLDIAPKRSEPKDLLYTVE